MHGGRRVRIALLKLQLSPCRELVAIPLVIAVLFVRVGVAAATDTPPPAGMSWASLLLISVGAGVVVGLGIAAWKVTSPSSGSSPADRARKAERQRIEKRIAELERE